MRISSDHNFLFFKSTFLILVNLQAVRSVASGGMFYRLPPDKENSGKRTNSSPLKGPIAGPCSSSPDGPWHLIFALTQIQSHLH